MTSRRARRGAATLVLCLSLVTVLATAACSPFDGQVRRSAAADGPPGQDGEKGGEPEVRRSPPVVMFLGDSYTVGDGRARPETTYASATARLLDWQVVAAGRAGSGFVVQGRGGQAFLDLFESQLGWRPAPDMIIVSGGHNDARNGAQQVGEAANVLLERVRQRWPGTHLVLLGPIWGTGTPPQSALAVRDELQSLAGRIGVPFIDPLAGQWVTGDTLSGTGNAPQYIKPDRTHPNLDGHRYLASRLAAELKRLDLARPALKD